jgi:type 1 glutamine amidotransferase
MKLLRFAFLLLAVPLLAPAATAPKIKVLIVDGFSNHDWQKTTALLRSIIEPTGLFEVEVSSCPPAVDAPGYDAWRPNFKAHDVVIQTCNDISRAGPAWPKPAQADFEAFVRDGGGVYIFHSAQNAFAGWPAYNEIIGLGWRPASYGTSIQIGADEKIIRIPPGEGRNTSHGPNGDVLIHRLGDHPIHAGMPRTWMTPHLEVYYNARGPAENVDVLSYGRDPRFGENWPIEWTVRYGQGRAYVATFGHVWRPGRGDNDPESEAMRCVGVQTTIVRVLEWLAKRPVTWPVPADFPTATQKSLRPLPKLDLPDPAPAAVR